MPIKLSKKKDGRYYKQVGYLSSGSQPKIYLGRDEGTALLRAVQVVNIWKWWRELCREMGEPLVWEDYLLEVAKAIGEGNPSVAIEIDAPGDLAAGILAGVRSAAPQISISLKDEEKQKEGERYWRDVGNELIEQAREFMVQEGNQRLHEAIDAYIEYTKEEYSTDEGGVTDWGQTKIRQITFCKEHFPDIRLADLDMERIDSLLGMIARRPVSKKTKGPISKVTAQATIKEFRQFIRWLHKTKSFYWKKPDDYEVRPIRIRLRHEEQSKKGAIHVQTYDNDQLKTLWEYATPWERCLTTLGLNCGFGMGEIATLQRHEVFIGQPHPFANLLNLTSTDNDSWIRRVRTKTGVYSEWKLWPVTVAALEWLLENRPQGELPYIVVTKKGTPFKVEGQRNNQIMNAWSRLTRRVKRDKEGFTALSFNKLRKTGANRIRISAGDELASLFLSHGQAVGNDELLANYTNPRFAALHDAIDRLGEEMRSVFEGIDAPFPAKEKRGGANISVETIRRISELNDAGYTPKVIGEMLSISAETVRRRTKEKQPAAKSPSSS